MPSGPFTLGGVASGRFWRGGVVILLRWQYVDIVCLHVLFQSLRGKLFWVS